MGMSIQELVGRSPSSNGSSASSMTASNTAHAACRFYVEIGKNDGSKSIQAVFSEVSGLQIERTVTEYEEGGSNSFVHKLPGRLKVGNITLKHGLTKSNAFLKWCVTFERRNVSVLMYDSVGKPVVRWNFDKAYPVKWVGPQFTAESTAIAIETIELAHDGVTVDP